MYNDIFFTNHFMLVTKQNKNDDCFFHNLTFWMDKLFFGKKTVFVLREDLR